MRLTPSFLDGVMLALSAAPEVCAVIDAPRCEMERVFVIDHLQDRGASLGGPGPYARERRVFALDWREGTDIVGTEDRLRDTLRIVARRHPGRPIVVLRGFLSLFVHTDLEGVASDLASEISGPLLVIHQSSTDQDWIDGWRATHDVLAGTIRREKEGAGALVVGFCVHRQEGDELGNLDEMERLWELAELPRAAWFLTGKSLSRTGPVAATAPTIAYPYAGGGAPDAISVELPIGFEPTARMLRALGARFDRLEQVERVVARERARLAPLLEPVVSRRLAGRGAAVVGDPWRVHGFWTALRELGVDVPLAIVLRRADAPIPMRAALEAAGTQVLVAPASREVQARFVEGAACGSIDFVVGSPLFRDLARLAQLPHVELASPYCLEHFTASTPFMGFEGLLRLADRIDNALTLHSYAARRDLAAATDPDRVRRAP